MRRRGSPPTGWDNIAIIGRGAIDGGGEFWWDLERRAARLKHYRPGLIRLIDCRNVLDRRHLFGQFWFLDAQPRRLPTT